MDQGLTSKQACRIVGIRKQSLHELMRKGQALLEAQRARLGVVVLRDRRRARLVEAGVPERTAERRAV
ncbi:hypothetical protein [Streptomyces anulatus]|uniref:hypothetical protein n=1 Tax=Streptomyces anulatus TaxID=1892 RepID=UPI00341BB28E